MLLGEGCAETHGLADLYEPLGLQRAPLLTQEVGAKLLPVATCTVQPPAEAVEARFTSAPPRRRAVAQVSPAQPVDRTDALEREAGLNLRSLSDRC